jgi:antitoxin component YwqK of YwqJK toxin-antitoxin module
MVGEAARLAILVAAAALAAPAAAEPFDVRGACRDGEPQGIYELRETRGALRVLGAFSRGKRTGSFIYWTTAGDRIAHLPYDEGAISGTVALWYPGAAPGREPQQQLEAAYARGVPSGPKRSWHPDGSRRDDYAYERGALVAARAWRANGSVLSDESARAQAARDADDEAKTYATLGAIVDRNLPACSRAPDAPRR